MRDRVVPYIYHCSIYILLCAVGWCIAGRMVWQGVRHMHYTTVRASKQQNKYRDTLILTITDFRNNTEIVWVKDDEIKYRGKMFDIKRRIVKGEDILLVGHYDEKDDKLFRLLKTILEGEGNNGCDDVPIWHCEALIPVYTLLLCKVPALPAPVNTFFSEPCIPLHKPSAPFLPPGVPGYSVS